MSFSGAQLKMYSTLPPPAVAVARRDAAALVAPLVHMPALTHWRDRTQPWTPEQSDVLAFVKAACAVADYTMAEHIARLAMRLEAIIFNRETKLWQGNPFWSVEAARRKCNRLGTANNVFASREEILQARKRWSDLPSLKQLSIRKRIVNDLAGGKSKRQVRWTLMVEFCLTWSAARNVMLGYFGNGKRKPAKRRRRRRRSAVDTV